MKTKYILLFAGLMIMGLVLSGCATGMTPSSWPGIGFDKETAYISNANHVYAVQLSNGTELWRFPAKTDAKKTFYASPVLTSDGQLIVGGYDKVVYSLDPTDGSSNWTFTGATDRIIGSVAVGNGLIYVPSSDYNLYALDLKGKLQWSFNAGGSLWTQPVVDANRVYFGSLSHTVYALDAKTGKLAWSTNLDGAILGSLTLGTDGSIYAGTQGNTVFALDSATGKVKWQQAMKSWIWSGPVQSDGLVFAGDQSGEFAALDSTTGKVTWTLKPDGPILGSALIFPDGVIFGTDSGTLLAVNKAGKTIWKQTINGKLYGTPVLAGESILVAPVEGSALLVAMDQKGTQLWVYTPAK